MYRLAAKQAPAKFDYTCLRTHAVIEGITGIKARSGRRPYRTLCMLLTETETASAQILSLPMFPELPVVDAEKVAAALKTCCGEP